MQYLKNALLVTMFALLGLGLEAAAPIHSFSSTHPITVNVPLGGGVVDVIQGRVGLQVETITEGQVTLTVIDSKGNVVDSGSLNPQLRRTNINTTGYADGVYLLIASTSDDIQTFSFTIETK